MIGAAILVQGVATSMAAYAVPEPTLASPHYRDAIFWVYSHTIVLGLVFVVVGLHAESDRLKLWFCRVMAGAQLYYLVLDTRSSDTPLGDGLYKGPGSIMPSIIGLILLLLLLRLCPAGARR